MTRPDEPFGTLENQLRSRYQARVSHIAVPEALRFGVDAIPSAVASANRPWFAPRPLVLLFAIGLLMAATVGTVITLNSGVIDPPPDVVIPDPTIAPSDSGLIDVPPTGAGETNPCLLLGGDDLNAVLSPSRPYRGEWTVPPMGGGLEGPERSFCTFWQADAGDGDVDFWVTNFWTFTDLSEWPQEPDQRVSAVMDRYGIDVATVREVEIGSQRVWVAVNGFVTWDDRAMYVLRLPRDIVVRHPSALEDFAAILVGRLVRASSGRRT